MGDSGSEIIRKMITEQIDNAGIKLSIDENIVVKINPENTYRVNNKHKAIILQNMKLSKNDIKKLIFLIPFQIIFVKK